MPGRSHQMKAAGIPSRRRDDDTNCADNEVQIMTSSSGSAKSSSSSNHHTRLHGYKRSYYGTILLLLLLLLYTLSVTQQPYFRLKKMSSYAHERIDTNSTIATQTNFTPSTPSQAYNSSIATSNTPLFYHISPGSTGSRTLYHAACMAGLPSVHHKSFCISSHRGVNGVSSRVVDGVHAHFELLRLYQIAYKCCSYWSKGFIIAEESSDGTTRRKNIRMKEEGDYNRSTIDLCTMSLDNWSKDIQTHLSTVLQSDIIGLFDTPYPLLASQVLDLGAKQRKLPTIVAMTKRDVASWAQSRSTNHNLMLCKQEFSYDGLGASEFDILGCVDRAISSTVAKKKDATKEVGGNDTNDRLYFWDVFEYRSRFEHASSEFLSGLEAQMEHHQTIYEPLAMYSPNFFGSSSANTSTTKLTDRQVTHDIQHLIINQQRTTKASSTRSKDLFKAPLTCGGTVEYDFVNDTFIEFYKHSKGCDGGLSSHIEDTSAGERMMLV